MFEAKPEPRIDPWNKEFWAACQERRLIAQRCDQTGRVWLPPSPVSPESHDASWKWVELSGRGTVWSFVIMHQKYFESFSEDIPYNIVQIELEEGAMIISNLIGLKNEDLEIGMSVQLIWETRENLTIPMFELSSSGEVS
jgi:uncharacterized OB-fold protein